MAACSTLTGAKILTYICGCGLFRNSVTPKLRDLIPWVGLREWREGQREGREGPREGRESPREGREGLGQGMEKMYQENEEGVFPG